MRRTQTGGAECEPAGLAKTGSRSCYNCRMPNKKPNRGPGIRLGRNSRKRSTDHVQTGHIPWFNERSSCPGIGLPKGFKQCLRVELIRAVQRVLGVVWVYRIERVVRIELVNRVGICLLSQPLCREAPKTIKRSSPRCQAFS